MATPKPTQEIDYNSLDLEELHSTPALNLDISQIALIQARVALNLMINRNPDLIGLPDNVNLLVFSNRLLKGVFSRPLHGDFYKIRKREECLVCGTRSVDAEAEAGRIIAHLTEHDRGSEKR